MKLSRNLDVKCPLCKKISKLGEWNDFSYSACKNREMRRTFVNLTDSSAFMRQTKVYYGCPKCGEWIGGNTLAIVNTSDIRLTMLGHEPVTKICSPM